MPLLRRVPRRVVNLLYLPKKIAFRSLLRAADQARDLGRTRKAVRLYKRIASLFPRDPSYHVQLGNMLKDSGRFDEARESYDAACDLVPDNADIYLQLGHLSKLQGLRQDAAAFYQRSSKLDPKRPDAREEPARIGKSAWIDDWTTQITASGNGSRAKAAKSTLRPLVFMSADRHRLVLERLMVSFENRPR